MRSDLIGKTTAIIIHYEGREEDHEVVKRVIKELHPLLSPDKRCHVITKYSASPPAPEPGEPTCSSYRFHLDTGMPSTLSQEALIDYGLAKADYELDEYDPFKIGYWTGTVRGRKVFVTLCTE